MPRLSPRRPAASALLPAVLLAAAGFALAGCVPESGSGSSTPSGEASDAAAYCVEKGGEIQHRQPTFGTNNAESTWVALGEPVETCRFRAGEGDTATAIYVDPTTLYSERPTLAALAYLTRAPVPAVAPANPASQLCVDLGGAVAYGPGADGGGLVLAEDPIDVVAVCTFADGSFIDEWGIAYFSSGTIRGADLSEMFRFDATHLPPVFPAPAG